MANAKNTSDANQIEIWMETILSNRTKEGMVNFSLKQNDTEVKTQWDIRKAKEIRDMLTECIEAAISDTLIYKFMHEKVGMSDEKASMVLLDFRELRQGKTDRSSTH